MFRSWAILLRQKARNSRVLSFVVGVLIFQAMLASAAQDGASYDPRAKIYHAPASSLAGAKDTPERTAAIGLLWQGKIDQSISAFTHLAESGDVPSALLLGNVYYQKSKLPIAVDPAKALHFFRLASSRGSGEASERIAEMIENKEIPSQPEGDKAFWRNLAAKQGWVEENLATSCFDWVHGPEPLHCKTPSPADAKYCPNDKEMILLRQEGLTGMIQLSGGGFRIEHGPQAKAILIVDHSVPTEQDLREPDATSVIYIQTSRDHWRMLPSAAPLLDRFIILTPNAAGGGRMSIAVQDVDGSTTGGACSEF